MFTDYNCSTVLVNVNSNKESGLVVRNGELIMSEREYVMDHTHPWVSGELMNGELMSGKEW